jgi:hypothetical protein
LQLIFFISRQSLFQFQQPVAQAICLVVELSGTLGGAGEACFFFPATAGVSGFLLVREQAVWA